ncbi:DUF4249 family protein [Pontibacter sp. MBLB2868]|uniref:DUF4249 family protein n=1 Tax=Pontibacter sp. MBLB2868 TaxID=3451555 RepID=UPI003F74EC61
MKRIVNFILGVLMLLQTSCEENLTLDIPSGEEKIVVEGHIEQGLPPFIILTRTVPVFTEVSAQALENAFLHNAQVIVSYRGQNYPLTEIASAALTDTQKEIISMQFGLPVALLQANTGFPFYVYTTDALKGEIGGSYGLRISHQGTVLTATTTIPSLNPLDSLWTMPHPDPEQDSLKILYYRYQDPDTLGNSVRYFTKRNSEPYYPGLFSSVFNDELINGGTIVFPLDRGEPRGQAEIDQDLYSYFGKGDTVTVRWAAIDLDHFRFWSTLEGEQNSNGSPIGSPNTTRSNIKGGLGIWGGYGVSYHRLIVK